MTWIGVDARGRASHQALSLVGALGRRVAVGRHTRAARRLLVLDPARGEDLPECERIAVWTQDSATAAWALAQPAVVCVVVARDGLEVSGALNHAVAAVDTDEIIWTAPFVRERRRQARGISGPIVLTGPAESWSSESAGCASLAWTTGAGVVTALAWGIPVVTDAVTARMLGLSDGRDCRVVSGPGAEETIAGLCRDPHRLALLAVCGRDTAEARFSLSPVVDGLLTALGWLAPSPEEAAVAQAVASLGTRRVTPALAPSLRRCAMLDRHV